MTPALTTAVASTVSAETLVNSTGNAPPRRHLSNKTVWYLGGNHAARLLTSVDGDLDPAVLEKLASVPAVIGELALSVESLVSDDCTVGGFEMDILARIAANTLDARKKAAAETAVQIAPKMVSTDSIAPAVHVTEANATPPQPSSPHASLDNTSEIQTTSDNGTPLVATFSGGVPNPLLENYDPVPNPLVRITPPSSPTTVDTTTEAAGAGVATNNKRKESPTVVSQENLHIQKAMRRSSNDQLGTNVHQGRSS